MDDRAADINKVRISLLSAAAQLNTEIKELSKDLSAISKLSADTISAIQSAFDGTVNWDGDAILNLCHLLGLSLFYECSLVLSHISQPRHRLIPILSHFERELTAKCKVQVSESTRHRIERCKRQRHPIVLIYGDGGDTLDFRSDASLTAIAQQNDSIWRECKRRHVARCPLCKAAVQPQPSPTPTPAHVQQKAAGHGHRQTMRIPIECLSPLHDKAYHKFGRQHKLPVFSKHEVSRHKSRESCWIIVNGLVLDVTGFLPHHPASFECIVKRGGGDATEDFKMHSKNAQALFMKFVIGRVERDSGACLIQ